MVSLTKQTTSKNENAIDRMAIRKDKSDTKETMAFRAVIEHGRGSGIETRNFNKIIDETKAKLESSR